LPPNKSGSFIESSYPVKINFGLDFIPNADSVNYVIRLSGLTTEKAEVTTGAENEEYFMVTSGLEEGDVILADPKSLEE
jgi:multidrug efflux pump subunit AcrA (membrane-fusion protein)